MSNRLYVGNLSFHSTQDSLRNAFMEFGEVTDVHLVSDRETGQSRGFGFVTMGSNDAAQNAIRSMNGALLDGRALKVNEAEERQSRGGGGGGGGGGGRGGSRGGGGSRW
jgi:RNA recognition motif-containing protein